MNYRKYPFFKFLCILLSVLLMYQADFLFAVQDVNQTAFDHAKAAYFNGDYEAARNILDKLITDLEGLEGLEVLRGETFLLAGATYEKLKYKKLSIKHYCRAKQILGQGRTFDPLVLKELKWYKKKCPTGAVIVPGKRKKKKGGGMFGTILGLAILGGLVWYLFINKNSPLKKDKDEVGEYTKIDIKFTVKVSGKELKRRDFFRIDGNTIEDDINTFPQACDSNTDESSYNKWVEWDIIRTSTGLGTFNLEHEIWITRLDPHCFNIYKYYWTATVSYEFSGGRDPGTPVVNITFPDPNQSNGWKDDVDVTIQMPTKRKKGQRVIRSGPIVPNIK